MPLLACYGTLRDDVPAVPGAPSMLHLPARPLGQISFHGRLYDTGAYPAAVAAWPDGDVLAQLWEIRDSSWTVLDAWENHRNGHPDSLFVPKQVTLTDPSDPRRVFAYLYNRPVAGLPEITSGCWKQHLATRP